MIARFRAAERLLPQLSCHHLPQFVIVFLFLIQKFDFKWVTKRENKMRELSLFQLRNQVLEVILRKIFSAYSSKIAFVVLA